MTNRLRVLLLALPLVILTPGAAGAQATCLSESWAASYDGAGYADAGRSIVVDAASNVYVVGTAVSSDSSRNDIVVLKYDPNGQLLWARAFDGSAHLQDQARKLVIDSEGSVYATGYTRITSSNIDIILIKYLANGDTAWIRTYSGPALGNDEPTNLALDVQGDIIVAGISARTSTDRDAILLKYSPAGELAWERTWPPTVETGAQTVHGFDLDTASNVYITSASSIIKYNPAGDLLWERPFITYGGIPGSGLKVRDGHLYVICSWTPPGPVFYYRYMASRYTTDGDSLWTSMYDWPLIDEYNLSDYVADLAIDGDGSVIVTGSYHYASYPGDDYCCDPYRAIGTLKFDADGVFLWERRYLPTEGYSHSPAKVDVDDDGIVTVWGNAFVGASAITALTYGADGNDSCLVSYTGPAFSSGATVGAVARDGSGNIYTTGSISYGGPFVGPDIFTVKFVPVCACHGDPSCDGVTNVVDVTMIINEAFRGQASATSSCPGMLRSDVDCDCAVTITDVVRVINVAFRGVDAAMEFCNASLNSCP